MHAGRIDNTATAAGRLYNYLAQREGTFFDCHHLTDTLHIVAIGTRVSEVRSGLRASNSVMEIEHKQIGMGHYYRITKRNDNQTSDSKMA